VWGYWRSDCLLCFVLYVASVRTVQLCMEVLWIEGEVKSLTLAVSMLRLIAIAAK
jgi:hypothetical protein